MQKLRMEKSVSTVTYSKKIQVWALIVNYNSAKESIEIFRGLKGCCKENFRVLVIDNASEENDIRQLQKGIPEQNLLINSQNKGYAAANNIGIKIALQNQVDYVWILNPDIRIEHNTLEVLLKTFSSGEKIAAVGPRILKREKPILIFSDGELLNKEQGLRTTHKNHNTPVSSKVPGLDFEVDYIDGSCILISCDAIREIGMLPEEYFLYFEETDWCYKSRLYGWKLAVNTGAIAYNLTSVKKDVFHYYYVRNRLIFAKKYNIGYRSVLYQDLKELAKEIIGKLKGNHLKPYFISRVKGLILGVLYSSLVK